MVSYDWPGNIRQLQNKLKSAVILADGQMIQVDDLSLPQGEVQVTPKILNLRAVREDAESKAIRGAYSQAEQNMSRTAELLGVTRPTLYSLIEKYNLDDLRIGV